MHARQGRAGSTSHASREWWIRYTRTLITYIHMHREIDRYPVAFATDVSSTYMQYRALRVSSLEFAHGKGCDSYAYGAGGGDVPDQRTFSS